MVGYESTNGCCALCGSHRESVELVVVLPTNILYSLDGRAHHWRVALLVLKDLLGVCKSVGVGWADDCTDAGILGDLFEVVCRCPIVLIRVDALANRDLWSDAFARFHRFQCSGHTTVHVGVLLSVHDC